MKRKELLIDIFFRFLLLHLIFSCYYCSIDLKTLSKHSGRRPGTSSLVEVCVRPNVRKIGIYSGLSLLQKSVCL